MHFVSGAAHGNLIAKDFPGLKEDDMKRSIVDIQKQKQIYEPLYVADVLGIAGISDGSSNTTKTVLTGVFNTYGSDKDKDMFSVGYGIRDIFKEINNEEKSVLKGLRVLNDTNMLGMVSSINEQKTAIDNQVIGTATSYLPKNSMNCHLDILIGVK